MMKKLLLTAAFAVLAAGAASAAVTIGETSYASISEAIDAANENDVINVTSDQTLEKALDFGDKTFTIQGAEGVKITRSANVIMLLLRANCKVTVKNLTFDGATFANRAIENKNNNSELTVEDCTFVNFPGNVIQTNKVASFKNIDMSTCENTQALFVGRSTTTLAGEIKCNLYIENQFSVTQEGDLTGAVDVYLANYAANRVVVKNCTTPAVYTLRGASEGYGLQLNEANNDLVVSFEKMVVKNETNGESYTSLLGAYDAASAGDVLVVLEDIDLPGRFLAKKNNLTVKGINPNVTITRTNTEKAHLMFEASGSNTLTLQDLIIDGNNIQINGNLKAFNCQGTMNLSNVVIKNVNTQSTDLIGGTAANLNNVTGENNGTAMVNVKTLTLNGNNNLPIYVADGATVAVAEGGELTNTDPISITFANPVKDATAISGTNAYRKFEITNEGFYLKPEGGNVVISDHVYTGIADITVDENASVEYFNLQGVRVANPENGLYIRRQGGKATKVYVK